MLPSRRLFYKQVDSIPKIFNSKVRVNHVKASGEGKIIIPPRIKREPTDILKALASTVKVDPTAFHYKYPDDPYFYTYSTVNKRVYALALESGRKSAKWIIKENPGFFKHVLSDPPVEAFLQKSKEVNKKELTEQDLLNAIEERNVLGAIDAYEALKSKGQDVPKSTKQSVLELLCFYNSNAKPELDPERKWFSGFLGQVESYVTAEEKWNEQGFAKSLFEEMDVDCPLAHSAIIQGMFKYGERNSALELFNLAKQKKIKLSVGVYNMLLAEGQSILKSPKNEIHDFVIEKLKEMSSAGIKPDLGTLNAILKSLSRTPHFELARSVSGRSRSLEAAKYTNLFAENVMQLIENKQHEVLHPSDLEFFCSAMDCFVELFANSDLALRLVDMYYRFDNSKFIVKAADESGFFKQLLLILFRQKPLAFAMNIYRRYICTTVCPNVKNISVILKALHENLSPEYLPEIWDDIVKLGFSKNRPLLGTVLQLIMDFTDESSLKVFHAAALSFMEVLEDRFRSGDEEQLWKVLMAFVKNNDEEMVLKAVQLIKDAGYECINLPESQGKTFMEYAISKKNVPLILESLKFACERGFLCTSEMAVEALPLLSGSDAEWARGLTN